MGRRDSLSHSHTTAAILRLASLRGRATLLARPMGAPEIMSEERGPIMSGALRPSSPCWYTYATPELAGQWFIQLGRHF